MLSARSLEVAQGKFMAVRNLPQTVNRHAVWPTRKVSPSNGDTRTLGKFVSGCITHFEVSCAMVV
jgi:hypothetical protein